MRLPSRTICHRNTQRTRLRRCCAFDAPPAGDPRPPEPPKGHRHFKRFVVATICSSLGLLLALLFIRDGAPNSAIRMHAATSAERKPLSVPHFPFPIFLFPLLPFSPFEFSSLQTLLFDVVFSAMYYFLCLSATVGEFQPHWHMGSKSLEVSIERKQP